MLTFFGLYLISLGDREIKGKFKYMRTTMRNLFFAFTASAALALVSAPSFAFDAPTLPGGYGVGGKGGVGVITGTSLDVGKLNINAGTLTGGDGGNGLGIAIGKDKIGLGVGGEGGAAGADMTVKDTASIKLDLKNVNGGWGGNGVGLNGSTKLKIELPGVVLGLLK